MSQLLVSKPKPEAILQDLVNQNQKPMFQTLALKAECYVCNKGLREGYSLTAKCTRSGKFLFCDKHYE